MTVTYNYDILVKPPAPFLDVKITNPSLLTSIQHRGKLYSGADSAAIPLFIVEKLSLQPRGSTWVTGYRRDEPPRREPIYYVDVELAGYRLRSIKAVGAPRPDVLVGRDILNSLASIKIRLINIKLTEPETIKG